MKKVRKRDEAKDDERGAANLVLRLQLLEVKGLHFLHERPGEGVEFELVSDLSHNLPQEPSQGPQVVFLPCQELLEHGTKELERRNGGN